MVECTCSQRANDNWCFTTLVCDSPSMFAPSMDGATQDESSGYGWFTAEEIADLPLHPGFERGWDEVRNSRTDTEISKKKKRARRVDLSGQQFTAEAPDTNVNAPGGGGPLKMPHDENDIWHESEDDYHAGTFASATSGGTAEDTDDLGGVKPHGVTMPAGDDGLSNGQARSVPPTKGPIPQGYLGGHWPQGGHGDTQPPAGTVGAGLRGTAPTIQTGKPLPKPKARKGAEVTEPHRYITENLARVYAQLRENFPREALDWVLDTDWGSGPPKEVPLKTVDFTDMKSWSAYKEPERVAHFERVIQHDEKFNPVVLVKEPGKKRYRIVDGHHRAMAFRRLGRSIVAWVGVIGKADVQPALETHSSQQHQGSSSGNE